VVMPGGGSATVLGFHWRQSRREHERILNQILLQAGGDPLIQCDNPNLWTMLRTDGRRSMLFVLNLLGSSMKGTIRFRDPVSPGTRHSLADLTVSSLEVRAWLVEAGIVLPSGQWSDGACQGDGSHF